MLDIGWDCSYDNTKLNNTSELPQLSNALLYWGRSPPPFPGQVEGAAQREQGEEKAGVNYFVHMSKAQGPKS